jgi:hypothetical protein
VNLCTGYDVVCDNGAGVGQGDRGSDIAEAYYCRSPTILAHRSKPWESRTMVEVVVQGTPLSCCFCVEMNQFLSVVRTENVQLVLS